MGRKIFLTWVAIVTGFVLSLFVEHTGFSLPAFISYSIQLLLFLVCVALVKREPIRKNKFLFLNFAVYFGLSILSHVYNFVGTVIFVDEPFARFYFSQYILLSGYFFFLAGSIVYLTVDLLFRDFEVFQKYVITFVIVGGFFVYYYHPYLVNPRHLYTTNDVMDWKTLNASAIQFRAEHGVDPSPQALAETTEMYSWKEGEQTGVLYPSEKIRRVKELYPYLFGSNYMILLLRPIYLNIVYMCVLSVGFILLFFGYQYMKDPPQGAYIDKIMFLFLIICSLEILHAWSFVKSVEWQTLYEILSVGLYVSIGALLALTAFFVLRLKFVTSAKGEFYEQEIAASPAGVTRWRDALDDLVIAQFFDRKAVLGRLFVKGR